MICSIKFSDFTVSLIRLFFWKHKGNEIGLIDRYKNPMHTNKTVSQQFSTVPQQ